MPQDCVLFVELTLIFVHHCLVAALREQCVSEKKAWRDFGSCWLLVLGSRTIVCAYLLHVAAGV